MNNNKLNLFSLILIGLSGSVGGAIVSYLGEVINSSSNNSIYVVIICLILGFCVATPYLLISKLAIIKGSFYSIVKEGLGETAGGIAQYLALTDLLLFSSHPITIAKYTASIFPNVNLKLCSIVFILIIFLICIFGVDSFKKIQNILTIVYFSLFVVFCVCGISYLKTNNPINVFTIKSYFPKIEIRKILNGIPLILFYTYGYYSLFCYGHIAKKPTSNIPKAMIICCIASFIFWILMTVISTNVLPIEEVSGKPLTYVANVIMPNNTSVYFVLFGVFFSIISKYITVVQSASFGFKQAAIDGWYPKMMSLTNKYNAPYISFILIQGVAFIIVLLDIPVSSILIEVSFLNSLWLLLVSIAFIYIPKNHPDLFSKDCVISKTLFIFCSIISAFINAILFVISSINLSLKIIIINVLILILYIAIATYKIKKNLIHCEDSFLSD